MDFGKLNGSSLTISGRQGVQRFLIKRAGSMDWRRILERWLRTLEIEQDSYSILSTKSQQRKDKVCPIERSAGDREPFWHLKDR